MPTDSDASPRASRRSLLQRAALRAALLMVFISAGAFVGCAPIPARDPASGCANCPVCLHNADLACVCVKVEADTPHAEWNGRTWYFCSEECRKAFLSDPKRFSPSGAAR